MGGLRLIDWRGWGVEVHLGSGFVCWWWGSGFVSWGRSGFVCWWRSGFVGRGCGGIFWGGLVWFGFVFGVDGFSGVGDIGDITVVVIGGVGHSLDTAIGKVYGVGATDSLAVSSFRGSKVSTRVVIFDSVFIGIGFGFVVWFWVGCIRSWGRFIRSRGGFVRSRGGFVGGSGFIGRWGWRRFVSGNRDHDYGNDGNNSQHFGCCINLTQCQKLN